MITIAMIALIAVTVGTMSTIIGNMNNVMNAFAVQSNNNDDDQGNKDPGCDPTTGNPFQSKCPHGDNGPNLVCHPGPAGPVCCSRATNQCLNFSS